MGHGKSKGRKTEAGRIGRGQKPWEWEETLGAARPLEWTPRPTEGGGGEGGREASGAEENPDGGRHGVGGGV